MDAGYSLSSDNEEKPKLFKKVMENQKNLKKENLRKLKGTKTMNPLESIHMLEMLKKELEE